MSIKDRLTTAYGNVAFNADETWAYNSLIFPKANQELFTKECQLQLIRTIELRPRTVRDCIPKSKLAQYSNYEYNEARELSYAPSSCSFNSLVYYSRKPYNNLSKEPWLLPEVDDLFIRFASYHHFTSQVTSNNLQRFKISNTAFLYDYESPMLRADSFDIRIMKMQICSDRIKNIWDVSSSSTDNDDTLAVDQKALNVYKSPTDLFCLSYDNIRRKRERKENIRIRIKLDDFEHLQNLSKTFEGRNCWIWKHMMTCQMQNMLTDSPKNFEFDDTRVNAVPSKRLYSAVLQGSSGNIKSMHPTNNKFVPLLSVYKGSNITNAVSSTVYPIMNCDLNSMSKSSDSCVQELSAKHYFQSHSNVKDHRHIMHREEIPQNVLKQTNNMSKNTDTSATFANFISSSSHCGNLPSNMQPSITYNTFSTSFPNAINMLSPQYSNPHNFQFNSPFRNNYQNNFIYSSTLTTNFSQIILNRGLQSLPTSNYLSSSPLIMMQQNRSPNMYPFSHQYVQQSLYPSSLCCQRPIQQWSQPDYTRASALPSQTHAATVSSNSVPQPSVRWMGQSDYVTSSCSHDIETHICKIRNKIRRSVPSLLNIQPTKVKYRAISGESMDDYTKFPSSTSLPAGKLSTVDNIQKVKFNEKSPEYEFEGSNGVLNENSNDLLLNNSTNLHISVASSLSEELEIQAIEEYCNFGDVYQELERQAEEQYEQHSENWISPPINELQFGGLILLNRVMYEL